MPIEIRIEVEGPPGSCCFTAIYFWTLALLIGISGASIALRRPFVASAKITILLGSFSLMLVQNGTHYLEYSSELKWSGGWGTGTVDWLRAS